ncbi:MAG: glycosyltransferase [Proteobacteria bacterium]|nr:glycosyltransferase [Pseudomonadota bacterium]
MNIGIVVRTLKIGGMERVAANLTDAFMDEGHTVTLMYLKDRPVKIRPERSDADIRLLNLDRTLAFTGIGILWIVISRILNMVFRKSLFVWQGFAQSFVFKRKIKKIESEKGRFDLMIFRGQGTFELIWANKDPRIIQVCESIFPRKHKGRFDSWYAGLLYNGKKVVCVSEGVKESFGEYAKDHGIIPESVTMITNPINIEKIKSRLGESIASIPQKTYILGLGRFVPHKNFSRLIRAYKVLVDDYDFQHPLVIIGDGRERDKLTKLTKSLGLEKRVSFPGSTDNPYAWMAKAELFILSSDLEGLGMVILEAFASGTNVVATHCPGGVSDIMGSGCLAAQLSDMTPESLAQVISLTLKQPFPEEEIHAVLEKFRPKAITDMYLSFGISGTMPCTV